MLKKHCGKIGFPTRAEAKAWARHAHHHDGAPKMRAYTCPRCPDWHLTTGTKTGRSKGGRR